MNILNKLAFLFIISIACIVWSVLSGRTGLFGRVIKRSDNPSAFMACIYFLVAVATVTLVFIINVLMQR